MLIQERYSLEEIRSAFNAVKAEWKADEIYNIVELLNSTNASKKLSDSTKEQKSTATTRSLKDNIIHQIRKNAESGNFEIVQFLANKLDINIDNLEGRVAAVKVVKRVSSVSDVTLKRIYSKDNVAGQPDQNYIGLANFIMNTEKN